MIEARVLGINQGLVDISERRTSKQAPDLDTYVAEKMVVIAEEQPVLHGFLESTETHLKVQDSFFYRFGATCTYEMLPENLRGDELSLGILEETARILHNTATTSGDRNGRSVNVLPFLHTMQTDSPAYVSWMTKRLHDIKDGQSQNDFILGACLVTMPFYLRQKARLLNTA